MRPRKNSSGTSVDVRRSSRILENFAKRKAEEDEFEEIQKKFHKADADKLPGYFSIFVKKKSQTKVATEKRSSGTAVAKIKTTDQILTKVSEHKRKFSVCADVVDEDDDNVFQKDYKCKPDSFFSIFDKGKLENMPEVVKRRGRPRKRIETTACTDEAQEISEINASESKSTKQRKDKQTICINLADDEESPQEVEQIEVKAAPEYYFISTFIEQELPLTNLTNHVQQLETEFENVDFKCDLNVAEEVVNLNIAISSKYKMQTVNSYFSTHAGSKLQCGDKTDHKTSLEDHRMWVDKYKPKSLKDIAGQTAEVELLTNWLSEWKQKLKPSTNNSDNSNSGLSFDMSDDEGGLLKCVALNGCSGMGKTSAVYAVARELGFKVFEVNPSSSRVGRHLLQQLQEATLSHHVQGIPKISPFFKDFCKARSDNPENGKTQSDAKTPCNTKPVKPKPGSITNFFKKANSPIEAEESQSPSTEKKIVKKSTLLNFFKPHSKEVVLDDTTGKDGDEELPSSETKACIEPVQNSLVAASKSKRLSRKANLKVDDSNSSNENSSSRDVTVVDSTSSGQSSDAPTGSQSETRKKRKKLTRSLPSKKEQKDDLILEAVRSDSKSSSDVSNPSSPVDLQQIVKNPDNNLDLICTPEMSKLKFCSLSVILFDDADVSLEVDEGFWSAINSFLKVTRKPVVLTTSRNTEELCDSINSDICLINFDRHRENSALQHLQRICEKEHVVMRDDDIKRLLKHFKMDIRQCLLQLQFWKPTGEQYICEHTFGLPLPLLCLRDCLADNIINWLFDWNNSQAAEIVFSCYSCDSNIFYSNMCLWLPFKRDSYQDERKNNKKEVKKYKRLDVSWLTDESSGDENEVSNTPLPTERNVKETAQLFSSLLHLSQLYDHFSEADVIHKSGYDFCDSFWDQQESPLTKHPYNHNMATEMASWVTMLSARKCRKELQNLPPNNISIFAEDKLVLNLESREFSGKLVKSRQNIANSVLSTVRLSHQARSVDYLSLLRSVQKCEAIRKEDGAKRSRRFLHYFEACGFTVEKQDLISISNAFL